MRKFIQNLLTISNLICGCIALHMAFNGQLLEAAYLIALSGLFDFFDGAAARWLSVSSEIGKQLDSLADLISFGLVPGALVFHLLENSTQNKFSFIALLIPICSAYRLAKFNIDDRQENNFIGLPTPANSLFFGSFPLIIHFQSETIIASIVQMPEIILFFTLVLSWSLVSKLTLFSFKFENTRYSENTLRFNFLALALILLIGIGFSAVPLLVLSYLATSVLFFNHDSK